MGMESTEQILTNHWALDEEAAEVLSKRVHQAGQAGYVEAIAEQIEANSSALEMRDDHRERLGKIFTGKTHEGLIVIGPCSLDGHSDYGSLFDYIGELQDNHPNSTIALRGNFAKPRTSGGWTGLWYSTDPDERAKVFATYQAAYERNIPILAEITQGNQLGALAPWMSAVWLGARDITSTTLRSAVSAVHLPVGVKNALDGEAKTVHDTIKAIRKASADNEEAGVDLGTIASNHEFTGIPTGILPVGQGNQEISIIARGYPLPEHLNPDERRVAALQSLSTMCVLASEVGAAVMIDGTHDVPAMFDIPRSNANRILPVLEVINQAVRDGEVDDSHNLTGILAEVGPNVGRTDPNFVLDEQSKHDLSRLIGQTLHIVSN